MDKSNTIQYQKIKAGRISVVVGLIVFLIKIVAYFLTSSTAIFSDVAESVVHIIATFMALFSLYFAAKPPDKNHLYGHGNIEYFSAGMEGILIILAAFSILYEAFRKILHGGEIHNIGYGIWFTFLVVIINFSLGFFLKKEGKRTNSLILEADGKHILTDSYTSGGVVLALILVQTTGIKIFDPIIAIIIAINIIVTGYQLIRTSVGGLMLESDENILNKIAERLNAIRKPYWIDIHQLRYFQIVDKLNIDFHIVLPYYLTIKEAHDIDELIRKELSVDFPQAVIITHLDYCTDEMCSFCEYSDCSYRTSPNTKKVEWSVEKLISKPDYK